MLETVNFSCGHQSKVQLSDNPERRSVKIQELETTGLCPECRKADWEKKDKEHSKGCICCRIENSKVEKFPDCEKRLTNYPREKDYTYLYVPVEMIVAEAFKKLIQEHKCSFDDAVSLMSDAFSKKYPELFARLKPVKTDDDTIYTDNNLIIKTSDTENLIIKESEKDHGEYKSDQETSASESSATVEKQEPEVPAAPSGTAADSSESLIIKTGEDENPVIKQVSKLNVGPYTPEKDAPESKDFVDQFFEEFDDISEAKKEISSAPKEIPVDDLMKNKYVIESKDGSSEGSGNFVDDFFKSLEEDDSDV